MLAVSLPFVPHLPMHRPDSLLQTDFPSRYKLLLLLTVSTLMFHSLPSFSLHLERLSSKSCGLKISVSFSEGEFVATSVTFSNGLGQGIQTTAIAEFGSRK